MSLTNEDVKFDVALDPESNKVFSADAKKMGMSRKNLSQLLMYIYLETSESKKLLKFAENAQNLKK